MTVFVWLVAGAVVVCLIALLLFFFWQLFKYD
jgi:ABC-type phosphate transport system auxiliary subunit